MQLLNSISYRIIGCAFELHRRLAPGLLESAYEHGLHFLLAEKGLRAERQVTMPLVFEDVKLDTGYRIDILVEDAVIVEIKSVEAIRPVHKAQVITYMRLARKRLGLLLNFNVKNMQHGIHRLIL